MINKTYYIIVAYASSIIFVLFNPKLILDDYSYLIVNKYYSE